MQKLSLAKDVREVRQVVHSEDRHLGAVTKSCWFPGNVCKQKRLSGSLAHLTAPKSLGTWQPCPGIPLTARETAHIQQLLLQRGKGHELGLICLGTGKSKETEKQSRLLKRLLIDCLREGTV